MSVLVSCQGIVCRLGGQLVLDRTDFQVAAGQSVALLGSSGSGKSTLLRVIAGLQMPQGGEVTIDGQLATSGSRLVIPPHRRGLAMLFQDLALWPNLTVAGNVRLGLAGLRLSRRQMRQRIDQVLALCEISELAGRRPGTLSGGQQQRVALARALAMRPRLLLLDEPFGGLDLVTKRGLLRRIVQLKSELGFAVVLVTHDPVEVGALCDHLAVLENGRIVDQGTPQQLRQSARTQLGQDLARAIQPNERT